MACLLQMLNSILEDTADFEKKDVKCSGTKVPRISSYSVVKNKQSVAFTDSEILICPMLKFVTGLHDFRCTQMYILIFAFKYLLSRDKIQNFLSERFSLLACIVTPGRLSLE